MTDPLAPLRALTNTGDLTTATDDDLYTRDRQLKEAQAAIPHIQKALTAARQAIAHELRHNRKRSWGVIAKGYGVSRTRIQQIIGGDTANAARRRARNQDNTDPSP